MMSLTRKQFDCVRTEHGREASWAVWGSADGSVPVTGDTLFFPADDSGLLSVLNFDYLILGLNKGNAGTSGTWDTFHTGVKHNDHVLGEALRGTPAWGAFMRDVSEQEESDSALVQAGAADLKKVLDDLAFLIPDADPVLVPLGSKATKAVEEFNRSSVPKRYVSLPHYSGQNGDAVKVEHERRFGPSGLPHAEKYKQIVHARFEEFLH